MAGGDRGPLAGLRVVEAALGVSDVGAGLAAHLPGRLLHDLGAEVAHVRTAPAGPAGGPVGGSTLDRDLDLRRGWDRGKELVDAGDDPDRAAVAVRSLAAEADVLLLSGDESAVERRGLGCADLARTRPGLVHVRIRPGADGAGRLPDLELLLHARTGLLTQIRGHRPGPAFCDLPVASAGAGLTATVGALARLYEREVTGVGGWAETSLHDGLLALLPMIVGRVEHPSPATDLLWKQQGPSESLSYRCADGGYVQLWFGAKGAYEAFLEHTGDPPSEAGYTADLVGGAMAERNVRWAERFASRDRAWWLDDLAGHPFRCEPVLRPGEALLDDHVREVGLAVEATGPDGRTATVLGPVGQVTAAPGTGGPEGGGPGSDGPAGPLLRGLRVLDLSAFLAGPVTPQVLAELGADVVKVEPATGDVHRSMEPMFAAGQRGKRAVALDLKAPGAAAVLDRLFRWSDVVHHNARVGLAERLGYDEDTVRAANPGVVYSHASGFGAHGPRARLAANDHLMQALSGVEAAQGGAGRPPTFLVWGAIDVTSGWVAASTILAGLVARRRTGAGQSARSTLLGAALLLTSRAHVAGGTPVEGPVLDAEQTGYGAAYRIYRCGDGAWLALAVPGAAAWAALRRVVAVDALPAEPPALRTRPGERQPAEELLEAAFAARPAGEWAALLRAAGVPAEPVAEEDRTGFVARLLDDPVGRQLGRVASFAWGPRGRLEQPGFPLRLGPGHRPAAPGAIPGLGEHTAEVLAAVGAEDPAGATG
jgi:crotonobetainyl-CoA:carnitine CoA-transferase CaiB-like acyl-CoA transferase